MDNWVNLLATIRLFDEEDADVVVDALLEADNNWSIGGERGRGLYLLEATIPVPNTMHRTEFETQVHQAMQATKGGGFVQFDMQYAYFPDEV